ncbi:ribonuclease J [Weizmannia acidilactici]|uniref:Ribonuclease J n=1 Tax=Weizmannia acidilactici TaxID=2607726 RepID=A0A5J4JEW3_9BACI|nr:ribonuclease J [Weizmannia acidilactici]GER65680.1 ribonuclease J [Weizmannia acidilactici]GER68990.1 ribonuclease J [Weizmannia acidilactici]GER72037.1 ribonuclease J [Weizmannia acidilactici]
MFKGKNDPIKVIPLGGIGEVGKNLYVVEIGHDIFVLDAGLMFPEDEMLGIDIVIPDFSYLLENKHRIKGIFLTHGHEDAIGALPYILMKLHVPVYATKLTIALAREKVKEVRLKKNILFTEVDADSVLHFDSADIRFFKTTHSIPDSVGICISTPEGNIVYTGDFKFDQEVTGHYRSDIGKMAKIGEEGVLLLLSDSTEAEHPGFTTHESAVAEEITNAFYEAKGRIIVASFASNLIRVQQILDAAHITGRKVAFVGNYLEKIYKIALKLGYLKTQTEDLIIPVQDISKYRDDELAILTTGSQGEPFLVLQKMAKKAHKQINIQKGDTVLLATTPSPGLELFMTKTIDMLYRAGAEVYSSKRKIHVTGHGCQEDLKLMLNLMKPKFFVPIQGEYRSLYAHAKLAHQIGIPKESVMISSNGEVLEYKHGKFSASGRVASGNILIDGIGVGDVGNIVLRDRRLLSQDGILIVVVTLDNKHKKIAAGPEIISRGFVYVRESEKLISDSASLVKEVVEQNTSKDSFDWTSIKQDIRDHLSSFLYEQTKRRPMILPIIMEV